jgi:hypothetical protein
MNRHELIKTLKVSIFFAAISFLLIFPLVYPLLLIPTIRGFEAIKISCIPPYAYINRSNIGTLLAARFPQYAYLGYSLIIMSVIPAVNYKAWKSSGIKRLIIDYWFYYLLIFLFFFLYASDLPIDFTYLLYSYVPFISSVRAVNVTNLILCWAIAVCAAIGYLTLSDRLKTSKHFLKGILFFAAILMLIFYDLTVGFEPFTMPVAFKDNNAYALIKKQSGAFRVIEIPSVKSQQAMTYVYTGRDTLNFQTSSYGFGFYNFLNDFSDLWWQLLTIKDSEQLDSHLVGYWKLDEGHGQKVRNEVSSNGDGIVEDISWEKGVSGYALEFNGQGSFVEIPHSSEFNLGSTAIIDFWLKLSSECEVPHQGCIVGKGGGWGRKGWLITTINKNHIRFHWQPEGRDIILDSATPLSYDRWHHVVCMSDGFSLKIYINGKRDPNTLYIGEPINTDTSNVIRIGFADNALLPFRGYIDEIRVYRGVPISKLLSLYGVKYVILNLDENYYSLLLTNGISAHYHWFKVITRFEENKVKWLLPFWNNIEETKRIEACLNSSRDFKLMYKDEKFRIYENLNFHGIAFAVKQFWSNNFFDFKLSDAKVMYSWTNPNTLKIYLENGEPVLLIVGQSFHDGWIATVKTWHPDGSVEIKNLPIMEAFSIQCLKIDDVGKHEITLHYRYYESSLMMYTCFYVLALALAYAVLRQNALSNLENFRRSVVKFSIFYGLGLIFFSCFVYSILLFVMYAIPPTYYPFVDKYSTSIFALGMSLISFAGIFYLTQFLVIRIPIKVKAKFVVKQALLIPYLTLITLIILFTGFANILPSNVAIPIAGQAFTCLLAFFTLYVIETIWMPIRKLVKRLMSRSITTGKEFP